MSITKTATENSQFNQFTCPRCSTALPADALFCGVCGERLLKDNADPQSQNHSGVAERYRITSLIRRRPYVLLFRAMDNRYQRPVTICDIDISLLDETERPDALKAVQHDYDQLRHQYVPDVMPITDLRYSQEHIFVVAGWPFAIPQTTHTNMAIYPYTLQDLLQSGIGLPDEQVALSWMYRLCTTLASLHNLNIVPGDLDPNTIVVSSHQYNGQPALTVSWLPSAIREMLPHTSITTNMIHFNAPETLQGRVEPRSDIYSMGAILYLLLTGIPPDEPVLRKQQRLRSPRELNPRVSPRTDELVMRALAVNSEQRFQSAEEMAKVLLELCSTMVVRPAPTMLRQEQFAAPNTPPVVEESKEAEAEPFDDPEDVTISIVPIQARQARWYLSNVEANKTRTQEEQPVLSQPIVPVEHAATPFAEPVEDVQDEQEQQTGPMPPLPEPVPRSTQVPSRRRTGELSLTQRLREQLSGVLPAITAKIPAKPADEGVLPEQPSQTNGDATLLKRLQRFVLGEQQHSTTAAALIETPLRVQPNQSYTIRIHLMGRSEPIVPSGAKKRTLPAGLSGRVLGETVHIEVRSALYQNYAYIVQRADVQLPAQGFAAEVTMPMHAISNRQSGRRERLQIYFMDEMRQPLYAMPFVVEVYISHLVQAGREGHNVLSIPL